MVDSTVDLTDAGAVGNATPANTFWGWRDYVGVVLLRLGIGRMRAGIAPGLYAVGQPDAESPVFVTANYRLSFDHLRRALTNMTAWVLVLDTKGINVWCAAGKGSFGTGELCRRIRDTRLAEIVSHRRIILPQLGAPGVAAHLVRKSTGFQVVYGPVRAADISAFMARGMAATPEMRRVRFDLMDRLAVVPVELMHWAWLVFVFVGALVVAVACTTSGAAFGPVAMRAAGLTALGFLVGCVLAPALLPWIPARAFAVKGALLGLAAVAVVALAGALPFDSAAGRLESLGWCLLVPTMAAFFAMNFTGSATFTSLSGVKREMRLAVPAQIFGAAAGLALWGAARFW